MKRHFASLLLLLPLSPFAPAQPPDEEIRAKVLRIARAFRQGDQATASKLAEAFAKTLDGDIFDVERLYKLRTKAGLGVGPPGAFKPDGIEMKLITMERKPLTDNELAAQADALTEMGFRIAAISEVARHVKPPVQPKRIKDYLTWAEDARSGGLDLAKAARAKDAAALKAATSKIMASCHRCHDVFRN